MSTCKCKRNAIRRSNHKTASAGSAGWTIYSDRKTVANFSLRGGGIMHPGCSPKCLTVVVFLSALWFLIVSTEAQLTDLTQAPNAEDAGIHKSLAEQIGAGRGDELTPNSSLFLIQRDPFRAIRRGRQLFQRKFTVAQGFGPRLGDGVGNIEDTPAIGHGLMDSCAGCHANPRGA